MSELSPAVLEVFDQITTVFQPIIDLDTLSVVGFEALSRGPAGTVLEDPIELIRWAKRHGCVGVLDWTCRARALETAIAADLPPTLAWFINVEPDAIGTPCPTHLYPTYRRATRRLRIVLEITERHDDRHRKALMDLARLARRNSWAVALDDLGVNPLTLVLIPVVQPDFLKLDASLLSPGAYRERASLAEALDRHWASGWRPGVLAEGIETAEQQQIAQEQFGARFGQGFLYGRPGPLPDQVSPPLQPLQWYSEAPAASPPIQHSPFVAVTTP